MDSCRTSVAVTSRLVVTAQCSAPSPVLNHSLLTPTNQSRGTWWLTCAHIHTTHFQPLQATVTHCRYTFYDCVQPLNQHCIKVLALSCCHTLTHWPTHKERTWSFVIRQNTLVVSLSIVHWSALYVHVRKGWKKILNMFKNYFCH